MEIMTTDTVDTPPPPAQGGSDKPRGRPFEPGVSGNPNGRPKGSRNKEGLAVEALLESEAKDIARNLIESALAGDIASVRFCLDRILPRRRDRPVEFDLPDITTAADAPKASAAILAACSAAILTPSEATAAMNLVERHVRVIEASEFETRLTALERRLQDQPLSGSQYWAP
jgi:hypothetical protein